MNPLVKDMLEATIRNDVETRFLEDLFEHEVKCESRHQSPGLSESQVSERSEPYRSTSPMSVSTHRP